MVRISTICGTSRNGICSQSTTSASLRSTSAAGHTAGLTVGAPGHPRVLDGVELSVLTQTKGSTCFMQSFMTSFVQTRSTHKYVDREQYFTAIVFLCFNLNALEHKQFGHKSILHFILFVLSCFPLSVTHSIFCVVPICLVFDFLLDC